jgi:type II secretory pathway pseudopilin PulG
MIAIVIMIGLCIAFLGGVIGYMAAMQRLSRKYQNIRLYQLDEM